MSPWRNSADYNFVNYFTLLRGSFCSIDNNGAREIFALYGRRKVCRGIIPHICLPFSRGRKDWTDLSLYLDKRHEKMGDC